MTPLSSEAADLFQQVSDLVSPIRWCTPKEVRAVTESVRKAAGDRSQRRIDLRLDYPQVPKDAAVLMIDRTADQLTAETHPLSDLLIAHLEHLRDDVEVISRRDDDEFNAWSLRRYGLPTDSVVAQANTTLIHQIEPREESSELLSTTDVVDALGAALSIYDLTTWRVTVAERLARMAVNVGKREILIRSDAAFTVADTKRLLVHEVGGHVLRAENAYRQPDSSATLAFGDATKTEEGLAAWLEEEAGVVTRQQRLVYAARALAVSLSRELGLLDLIRTLEPWIGLDDAVAVALRVKRGLRDPNKAGGFTKDHAYLSGLDATRSLLQHNRGLLAPLMATRWPLEMLQTTQQLIRDGALRLPNLLPDTEALIKLVS